MTLDTIRRRRVPIALGVLVVALWLLLGLRRIDPGGGVAVLDAPTGLLAPRLGSLELFRSPQRQVNARASKPADPS